MKKESGFISILSDYGFKIAFADKTNTLFLRKALQALIGSEEEIKKIRFLRNEFEASTQSSRGGVYDVLCEDENGRSFIVEMQLSFYKNFMQRAKFYAFHRFETMVRKGNFKYNDLKKIYCISFLGHNIFPNSKLYYHYGTLKNQENIELDSQITHIVVEISKFEKELKDIESNLDKLIFLMKNLPKIKGLDELPKVLTEDWLKQAIEKVDKSQMTPEQLMFWNMTLAKNASILEMEEDKRIRDMEAGRKEGIIAGKKEGIIAGKKVGKKEGIIEGKKAGKKEGIIEGELKKEREIAKRMKEKGISLDIIVESTGLSLAEIKLL